MKYLTLVALLLLAGCGETINATLPPPSVTAATVIGSVTVATPGGPVSVTIPAKQ